MFTNKSDSKLVAESLYKDVSEAKNNKDLILHLGYFIYFIENNNLTEWFSSVQKEYNEIFF